MSNKFKVIATDKVSDKLKEVFASQGIDFKVNTSWEKENLKEVIAGYDGLIIRSKTKVTKELLEGNTSLKVIGRAGIGVDNVDISAATEKGIVVMNTPLGNTVTTAEHAISLLVATARQVPYANLTMHQGKWEKSNIKGTEITGKTLGLIGCGNIGSIVANRALGLKLKVIVHDPYLSSEKADSMGVSLVGFDELLGKSDFISIHTPLTDKTKNLINKTTMEKMKPGVRIINCARGGIVNEDDLMEFLENKRVASAALDVFQKEPLPEDSPLKGIPNLILTPHLGGSTEEAQERVSVEVGEQICLYLNEGTIVNGYNVPALNPSSLKKLRPFKKVAYDLGYFLAQIRDHAYKKVSLEYYPEFLGDLPFDPIVRSVLTGLMKQAVDGINEVNALHYAKARGFEVEEIKKQIKGDSKSGAKQNSLTINVLTQETSISIKAVIYGAEYRITSINDVDIDVVLQQNNLYLENKDEPGFVKDIATILSDEGINIASFQLGRKEKGGKAVCIITLDGQLDDKLLESIKGIKSVITAKLITFP